MPSFNSQIGNWTTLKEHCKLIRFAVFVVEQNIPNSIEIDGLDEACHHIVIFNAQHKPIATARLSNKGKLGRMAVLKPYRRKGVGNELLSLAVQLATRLKLKEVVCHAQLTALRFYEKNGFLVVGNTLYEAGMPHVKMAKTLFVAEDTLQ